MKKCLLQLYQSAVVNKLKIVGIKTDCILIRDSMKKVEGIFDFTDKIDDYKFEKGKSCINKKIFRINQCKQTINSFP